MFNFIKKIFKKNYGTVLCLECRVYDEDADECCHQKNIVKRNGKYKILKYPFEKNKLFNCKDFEKVR